MRAWIRMIEKIFKHASASEAGDYYQVSFDDDDDPESIDGRYLLIQRQFEFPDDDSYYLESDDSRLSGHVKVRAATLNSEFLSIDLLADEWTTLRIRYAVSQDDFEELERIVRIMFEDKVLRLD
jgi:hypothetical protein